MKKRYTLLSVFWGITLAGLFAVFSWVIMDEMISGTSGSEFCASCHSMEPMKEAYLLDVHGGKGSHGVAVPCTACHLPHKSKFGYLFAKAKTGIHDVYMEFALNTNLIDWESKRERREEFVYDSGCRECHVNLERASMRTNKGYVAHRPYFLGKTMKKCVTCHKNVGHKNLSLLLLKTKRKDLDDGKK